MRFVGSGLFAMNLSLKRAQLYADLVDSGPQGLKSRMLGGEACFYFELLSMNELVLGGGLVSFRFGLREGYPSGINPESRPFLFYDGEAPLHLRLFLRSLL